MQRKSEVGTFQELDVGPSLLGHLVVFPDYVYTREVHDILLRSQMMYVIK